MAEKKRGRPPSPPKPPRAPAIGNIVLIHSPFDASDVPAMVTRARPNGILNVTVFPDLGEIRPMEAVRPKAKAKENESYWSWPEN